jgi:hypothetical protein
MAALDMHVIVAEALKFIPPVDVVSADGADIDILRFRLKTGGPEMFQSLGHQSAISICQDLAVVILLAALTAADTVGYPPLKAIPLFLRVLIAKYHFDLGFFELFFWTLIFILVSFFKHY